MIFPCLAAIVTAVAAIGNTFDISPEHTMKTYTDPPPVLYSSTQNPFLSLPESPAITTEGSDGIEISVPPPLTTYLWELTGYYRAEETGEYAFSIGEAELATIQLGWKSSKSRHFYTLVTDETHDFGESPVFTLEKGVHYPIKITYIGQDRPVPVFVSKDGKTKPLGKEVRALVPSIAGKVTPNLEYTDSGFAYFVYLVSGDKSHEELLQNYLGLELVQDGHLDSYFSGVWPPTMDAPHIVEITGHFRPPADGVFRISLADWLVSGLQIGPGSGQKQAVYTADETWRLVDTRVPGKGELFFESSLVYPFRLVVLANGEDFRWDVSVTDSEDREVDLFRLWKRDIGSGVWEEVEGTPGAFSEMVPGTGVSEKVPEPGSKQDPEIGSGLVPELDTEFAPDLDLESAPDLDLESAPEFTESSTESGSEGLLNIAPEFPDTDPHAVPEITRGLSKTSVFEVDDDSPEQHHAPSMDAAPDPERASAVTKIAANTLYQPLKVPKIAPPEISAKDNVENSQTGSVFPASRISPVSASSGGSGGSQKWPISAGSDKENEGDRGEKHQPPTSSGVTYQKAPDSDMNPHSDINEPDSDINEPDSQDMARSRLDISSPRNSSNYSESTSPNRLTRTTALSMRETSSSKVSPAAATFSGQTEESRGHLAKSRNRGIFSGFSSKSDLSGHFSGSERAPLLSSLPFSEKAAPEQKTSADGAETTKKTKYSFEDEMPEDTERTSTARGDEKEKGRGSAEVVKSEGTPGSKDISQGGLSESTVSQKLAGSKTPVLSSTPSEDISELTAKGGELESIASYTQKSDCEAERKGHGQESFSLGRFQDSFTTYLGAGAQLKSGSTLALCLFFLMV